MEDEKEYEGEKLLAEWLRSMLPERRDADEEEEEVGMEEVVMQEPAEQEEPIVILSSESSLMKRFQDLLKDHLNRQLRKLNDHLCELVSIFVL